MHRLVTFISVKNNEEDRRKCFPLRENVAEINEAQVFGKRLKKKEKKKKTRMMIIVLVISMNDDEEDENTQGNRKY